MQRRNQERLQRIEAQRKPQALEPLSPGEVYGGQYKTQAATSPEPEKAEEPEESPDLRTVIAERLQSEDFELSYNLLAAESGVDSGTISRFVRGERDITTATAWKLCKVLGLVLVPIERVTS